MIIFFRGVEIYIKNASKVSNFVEWSIAFEAVSIIDIVTDIVFITFNNSFIALLESWAFYKLKLIVRFLEIDEWNPIATRYSFSKAVQILCLRSYK